MNPTGYYEVPEEEHQCSHIYPIEDLKDHVLHKGTCWCNPEFDEEDNIWIHNSMDKREDYEIFGLYH